MINNLTDSFLIILSFSRSSFSFRLFGPPPSSFTMKPITANSSNERNIKKTETIIHTSELIDHPDRGNNGKPIALMYETLGRFFIIFPNIIIIARSELTPSIVRAGMAFDPRAKEIQL